MGKEVRDDMESPNANFGFSRSFWLITVVNRCGIVFYAEPDKRCLDRAYTGLRAGCRCRGRVRCRRHCIVRQQRL